MLFIVIVRFRLYIVSFVFNDASLNLVVFPVLMVILCVPSFSVGTVKLNIASPFITFEFVTVLPSIFSIVLDMFIFDELLVE